MYVVVSGERTNYALYGKALHLAEEILSVDLHHTFQEIFDT